MRFHKFGHHLWSHICTLQMRCQCDTANRKDSTQHDQKVYLKKNKKRILLLRIATNYLWLYLVYTNIIKILWPICKANRDH
jgi:uncharacterized protein YeeX (DUF496 family)